MSAPSEPEKYSIDEMMDRLKNRSSEDAMEDGELVTRADGSQAIRVRKKKRRSHQPHKEERRHQRRARMLQVSGALILLLLGIFAAGVAIVYANSAPFRDGLVKKISLSSGAEADLRQFRMNPTTANATALNLVWPAGNVLESLQLRTLKAELSPVSFLGKSMVGQELHAEEGTLALRIPSAGQSVRATPASDAELQIRFDQYTIPKFHLLIGDPSAPGIRMRDSEATFVPPHTAERPQLLLTRGNIDVKGWPKLRMDRAHIEFRGNEADIVGMRLRHESDSRGVFELSGTISPYAADRASTLTVQLESFLMSGIVGDDLGKLFAGRVDTTATTTSNYLSFTPGPDPASSLSVTFRSTLANPFEVSGFPFLYGLAQTLDDEWFSRPVFDSDIRGTIRRANGNIALGDLNFENKSRMALRGGIVMATGKKISGTLEVGIAEGMIKTAEDRALEAIFSPARDGFRWISLNIGGTAMNPTDNFKDLYGAALNSNASAPGSKTPSFEELTRPK